MPSHSDRCREWVQWPCVGRSPQAHRRRHGRGPCAERASPTATPRPRVASRSSGGHIGSSGSQFCCETTPGFRPGSPTMPMRRQCSSVSATRPRSTTSRPLPLWELVLRRVMGSVSLRNSVPSCRPPGSLWCRDSRWGSTVRHTRACAALVRHRSLSSPVDLTGVPPASCAAVGTRQRPRRHRLGVTSRRAHREVALSGAQSPARSFE